jgi:hypothetical protein
LERRDRPERPEILARSLDLIRHEGGSGKVGTASHLRLTQRHVARSAPAERGSGRNFFERSDAGRLDLPSAREGGFGGGFFACWTPPHPESGWTEESALTITEDDYEVADVPPLDPIYAKKTADELARIPLRIEVDLGGR